MFSDFLQSPNKFRIFTITIVNNKPVLVILEITKSQYDIDLIQIGNNRQATDAQ